MEKSKPTRDDVLGLFDDILQGKSLEPHKETIAYILERMNRYEQKETTTD